MHTDCLLESAAESAVCASTAYDRKENIVELIDFFLMIGGETGVQMDASAAGDRLLFHRLLKPLFR
ncbi:MAG: hypothetical protein K2W95_27270 [Candidatus Obscuribacterales bacterium]|nr:hypothetical protein [Candidatus Obscuribacterales bacterium]